jgi:sterol desaturase/sphingolipid hydroxylase (fatty acid hydroxylase superfamily)
MNDTMFDAPLFEQWLTFIDRSVFSQSMAATLSVFFIFIVYDVLRQGWKASITGRWISSSLGSIGILCSNLIFAPIAFFAVGALGDLYTSLGIPHLPNSLWEPLPFWLAGIIAIIAHDFVDYWNHRAMHKAWIWPIHAIHHSDEEVNALTMFRVHFLEYVFMQGSYIILLSWAGFSAEAAAFGVVLRTLHNSYVHANLDWDHGPFKLLIASPRFHRWHHANEPEAFGKNLANLIPLYDYMFGTYYDPGRAAQKMGADGVPHSNVIALVVYPFKSWAHSIGKVLRTGSKEQNSQQAHIKLAE